MDQSHKVKDKKKKESPKEREKKFLINELQQIKNQLYAKLNFFKARTQGKKQPSKAKAQAEAGLFEILDGSSIDEILRKEIDHLFIMTQILNSIVLKGDETYKTMQELAKLTNDQDQVSLD